MWRSRSWGERPRLSYSGGIAFEAWSHSSSRPGPRSPSMVSTGAPAGGIWTESGIAMRASDRRRALIETAQPFSAGPPIQPDVRTSSRWPRPCLRRSGMGLPIGEALELHVKLLDLLRLRSRRCDPLGHDWPFHDPGAVIRAIGVEPHVIGEKARADRRVHGVGG